MNLNRYLLVMAEFDKDMIPKPALEALPAEPAAEKTDKTGKAKPAAKGDKTEKGKEGDKAKAEDKGKTAAKAEPPKKEPPKPDLKAERQRIEKENKRKLDQYNEQIAAGKKHVQELNNRFADWYYVISDDVYHKLRLSREQIVKKKEKKDAGKAGHDESLHHHHDDDHDHKDADEDHKPDPVSDLKKLKEEGLGEKH